MFIRKIGKLLRGKATSFQIICATVLGALLGSLPGVTQGPLLMAVLIFLVIILNANLFLAGITLLLVKLISLLLLPYYFQIGAMLLESPLAAPISILVNAPVTAWFGFDYYVMIPSLATGLLVGLFLGIWLSRSLLGFRRKMAELEAGSERYNAYASKLWVKILAWLFVGGARGNKSWAEMSTKQRGMPVRPLGIVFVLSLVVLGVLGYKLLDKTIVTTTVRDALEKANGATVDIEGISILPGENRIVVSGLALSDPEALDTNRFASREVIADISGLNILAKKVVIDSLQILEPKTGTSRRINGRRTIDLPRPDDTETAGGDVNIDDYIGEGSVWRERLATIRRLYERIAPLMKKDGEEEAPAAPGEPGWHERLAQRASEVGYAKVKSDTLIMGSPRFLIRELIADNLVVGGNDDLYAISGSNLSSQPALLEDSGEITVSRMDGNFDVTMNLPSEAMPNRSTLKIRYGKLSISELEARVGKDLPMDGGTMDIEGEGTIDGSVIDLPLRVTLNNTTLNAFGSAFPLNRFPLEVRVYGPMDAPRLSVPQEAIQDAVKSAGKSKIENLIKDKAGDKLKGFLPFGG